MKTVVILIAVFVAVVTADECDRACVKINSPVCGTFSATFSNECMMNEAACKLNKAGLVLTDTREGECDDCNRACTSDYNPVCGSDGNTYPNQCSLRTSACRNGEWVEVASMGACSGQE